MTTLDRGLAQCAVVDSTMAYREGGRGDAPVALFLHGNPTSSFIWRNIIPHVTSVARCVAPDLIGFGQSGKPDIAYRFDDHVRYLDAFLDCMGFESTYLIGQDWGAALAFHLAARRPGFVRGVAFMEFIRPFATWDEFHQSDVARDLFRNVRTPDVGEKLVLDANVFVERVLPGGIVRTLTDDEMAAYRAPFVTRESRRPIWRLANDLPIARQPVDVHNTMERAHEALVMSDYPKLLFAGNPGALVTPEFAQRFAKRLKNCKVVQLASGMHYLPESQSVARVAGGATVSTD